MAKVRYEPCPKCRENGKDRRGDNLARYSDGGGHCFSCGHHVWPKGIRTLVKDDHHGDEDKTVLPSDFSREVPARAWQWLLQYGLPFTYWRPFVGWSEKDKRLVLTVGNPVRFSIGRYFGTETGERTPRKWWVYGDRSGFTDILQPKEGSPEQAVVLVEDIISWHKVGQVAPSLCLFGVKIGDPVIKKLIAFKRPVTLWLDRDQLSLLAPKLNRIAALVGASVRYVSTDKDPKMYSTDEIKEILA